MTSFCADPSKLDAPFKRVHSGDVSNLQPTNRRIAFSLACHPAMPLSAPLREPTLTDLAADERDTKLLEEGEMVIQEGTGIFETASKILKAAKTVGEVGTKLIDVATGQVGTALSNKLSEKFSKNPNWAPGFAGEKHVILPTRWGLTRANFAGPGTNLSARLSRGDKPVDGPRGIDAAALIHDILYSRARTVQDVRDADDKFIRDVRASSAGTKSKLLAISLLRAKKFGEDVGAFNVETFTTLPGLKGSGILSTLLKGKHKKQVEAHLGNIVCDFQGHKLPVHLFGSGINPAGGGLKLAGQGRKLPAALLRESLLEQQAEQMKGQGVMGNIVKAVDPLLPELLQATLGGRGLHGQEGGQLGLLAGLASNLLLPPLIKAFGNLFRKKR